jgi:GNAT superfamily N-acetyltransferase
MRAERGSRWEAEGTNVAARALSEHCTKEQAMNDKGIYIRVATGHDREKLRGMLARSSSETIYRRFHIPYPEVPEWMLALMLGTDHHDKESLVAVAEEKIVGHAMYVRQGDDAEAEMAIVVEDQWQSIGIGKSLLSALAERAKRRGILTFTAQVLASNRPMLGLADVFPGTEHTMEDGARHVRMPLQAPEPTASAPRDVRRAA